MLSDDRHMAYSPSPSMGPQSSHLSLPDHEKYITELLAERHKIGPFLSLLPCTSRLLNQEILHVSALLGIHPGFQHCSPLTNGGAFPNGRPADMNGCAPTFSPERAGMFHSPPFKNWPNAQSNSSGFIVRKIMRMDIPVDNYPHFNVVGRLLGPRGKSLKRVEATTDCRVLIRGRGSIKDPARAPFETASSVGFSHKHLLTSFFQKTFLKIRRGFQNINIIIDWLLEASTNFEDRLLGEAGEEVLLEKAHWRSCFKGGHIFIYTHFEEEFMRGKPGYEHLDEPLHLVIEAELPVETIDLRLTQAQEILDDVLKPVDESVDFFKKQQLRELAIINGTLRDDTSPNSGSVSPFHDTMDMKRAKSCG